MPKNFKHKDAKEQISYFRQLLSDLKQAISFKQTCKIDLTQLINQLHSADYFSDTVTYGLIGKETDLPTVKQFLFSAMFSTLKRLRNIPKYVNSCIINTRLQSRNISPRYLRVQTLFFGFFHRSKRKRRQKKHTKDSPN